MILSKPSGYAIRALVYLATYQEEGPILSARIAEDQSIPAPFLVKILSSLMGAGYVRSVRGPGGGFKLARDPSTIRLIDILNTFERFGLTEECLLARGKCSQENPCQVHNMWSPRKEELVSFLESTTIAQLAQIAEPEKSSSRVHKHSQR